MSKQTANLICLLVAAIWGGGFLATAGALEAFDPFSVLMIRFIGAAIVSWIVIKVKKLKVTKEALIKGSISGVLMYLAFAFQTFGLDLTNTGQNAFLTSVNVVLVPYISWFLFKRKPMGIQVFASFICLAGIACLSLSSDGFYFSFGDLLSLICAFFFASQIISLEFATKNCDSTVINTIQMCAAAIVSIPFALILEDFPTSIDTNVILSCLYMICIATWLAFQLQTLAQKYTDASSASLLLCTESLFANIFGYFLLHEEKTLTMVFGGLLIFISVILVESSDRIKPVLAKLKRT